MMSNMRSISRVREGRGVVLAETEFSISYDGPALAEGRIPVRDLAPSLFAMGELFRDVNRLLNPDGVEVSLDVRGDGAGSFWVHLTLRHLQNLQHVVDLLAADPTQAIVNLRDLVIMGGGVFWWIQRRQNRRVVQVQPAPGDPDSVTVTLDDQDSVTLPRQTYEVSEDAQVRQRAKEVVTPLEREGISTVEFRRDDAVTVSLGEDEVEAFDVPDEFETRRYLSDNTYEIILTIETAVLTDEVRDWRFSDGERSFSATVEDESFLASVATGAEVFRAGDRLRCRVRHRQYESGRGIENERTILEVREHARADPPQPELPIITTEVRDVPELPAGDTEGDQP
jgi:hypothetical protein